MSKTPFLGGPFFVKIGGENIMMHNSYNLWCKWQIGLLTDEQLSKEELQEIEACEFAMHLLIPTESLLNVVGGYDKLQQIDLDYNDVYINYLSDLFKVPRETVVFKTRYLLKQMKNRQPNSKILKKEGNIIFGKFE